MKQRQWKRWTAALSAAAILLTPMATQAQSPDQETTQINHALTGTATANNTETNYWGADKAIDGIVNRDETNKQNQSRWSTNGARTFDQVAQKDKVTDSLTLEAVDAQGVYWGTRSVLQILSQNGDSIPQGTARDYPAYEVRGFILDVGRKPISYEFLQTIVKEMAWYKMNDFQLHLNDNSFQKEYPNATVEIAKKAYSGFRLESTIKEGGLNQADLTSKDTAHSAQVKCSTPRPGKPGLGGFTLPLRYNIFFYEG